MLQANVILSFLEMACKLKNSIILKLNRYKALLLYFLTIGLTVGAKSFSDAETTELVSIMKRSNTKYVIRYPHHFKDTLFVPSNCELIFKGGSLSGPIVFQNTKLSGDVNLKGSSVSGTINNKWVNAQWLCYADGITDDAKNINELIEICGNIIFAKGRYRLISSFDFNGVEPSDCTVKLMSHIGIGRSNVILKGREGATFVTDVPICTICAFTPPGMIDSSIHDISICNLTFEVHNNGRSFHEFSHSIKLVGVDGVLIKKCTFNDFWGDAICFSSYNDSPDTGERTRNQNAKILNNVIIGGDHHNNRNGISIVSGKNILISGNLIKSTSRKDMPGGIDIEPNNSAYTITDIIIKNNDLEGIKGGCGAICVVAYKGGPAHDISIIGNRIRKSNNGLFIYIKTNNTTGNFLIEKNFIDAETRSYKFEGSGTSNGWIITNNKFEYPSLQNIPGDINVQNLIVKNNKKKG